MKLFVSAVALREIVGEEARLPSRLRSLVARAIEQITVEELGSLLAKHETDADNLDGRIEANLRRLDPTLKIEANCRISARTNFNSDLVIESEDGIVCLEIEKGDTSRFELDILKMMVFACRQSASEEGRPVYGAFIVPSDNVVARHISGNARESSFQYLTRLFRLVGELDPSPLADILVMGYGATKPVVKARTGRRGKPAPRGEGVTESPSVGLIKSALGNRPSGTVLRLRELLMEACSDLREKLNPNGPYLGYAVGDQSNAIYVYVRKSGLLIDLRIPKERAEAVRAKGFEVRERDNYQSKAGWLTGLRVPHDTGRLDEVVQLALEALRGG